MALDRIHLLTLARRDGIITNNHDVHFNQLNNGVFIGWAGDINDSQNETDNLVMHEMSEIMEGVDEADLNATRPVSSGLLAAIVQHEYTDIEILTAVVNNPLANAEVLIDVVSHPLINKEIFIASFCNPVLKNISSLAVLVSSPHIPLNLYEEVFNGFNDFDEVIIDILVGNGKLINLVASGANMNKAAAVALALNVNTGADVLHALLNNFNHFADKQSPVNADLDVLREIAINPNLEQISYELMLNSHHDEPIIVDALARNNRLANLVALGANMNKAAAIALASNFNTGSDVLHALLNNFNHFTDKAHPLNTDPDFLRELQSNVNLNLIDKMMILEVENILANYPARFIHNLPLFNLAISEAAAAISIFNVEYNQQDAVVKTTEEAEFIHSINKTEVMVENYHDAETRRNLLASNNQVAKSIRMKRLGI